MKKSSERVGITSSVPVEVLFAAGARPVDLNNLFITGGDPRGIVEEAEAGGFPRNVCAWIKGIYEVARRDGDLRRIIAVTEGDCSNVRALVERWRADGKVVLSFSYPYDRDARILRLGIQKLMETFGVSTRRVGRVKERLDRIRRKLQAVDRLTWREHKVTGAENHAFLISGSDFRGDPDAFEAEVDSFLRGARRREADAPDLRIGLVGIPPIWTDFFEYLESQGARVVYNELARQFALLPPRKDLVTQYLRYTYPYHVAARVRDIRSAIRRRGLDGIIHNVQSFCSHQIEDGVIREKLDVPGVMVEGDKPGPVDARTQLRLDSFLSILRTMK